MKFASIFFSSLVLFFSSCAAESTQERLSDNEIIKIMMTVDKGEIAASQAAEKKNVSSTVDAYAKYLIQQHQANLEELTQLSKQVGIEPKDSSISNSLDAGGKKDLEKLSDLQGKALEKAYIDTMVKGHQDGLQLTDTKLITEAQNPQVKAFVQKFRKMVSDHLQKGLEIQKNLPS